ncbi:FAD-dependent oxidoreductase [Haloquadratum walsbyi]|uniref:NAD(FAD)-dependent dehydrogenase n=1 Tax=Haloquadratum walsbyi J07HQW2 TaxID=1238425 RepID=U1NG73_9EURY|nr:FAD-dependent oxidoreductase [Haloquadratum walsbyi]ERG96120.1 MAG: NAD(FAD)-dependent dehydrogenase [Haloquadratum walsbyi J07HQW2]
MTDPFVVIGGDAAGLSAASKCRRETPTRDVVVFEQGSWVSYAHCGTPYFIKGDVEHLSDLQSLSPGDIEERGIDLRRNHEVTTIDTESSALMVSDGTKSFEYPYEELLIATGARAVSAPIEGADLDTVFTLHGLPDATALRSFLTPPAEFDSTELGGGSALNVSIAEQYGAIQPPETIAIVGGGYVGVEMAEAFSAWDCKVHLFQRSERLLPAFGTAVGDAIVSALESAGVIVHLNEAVDRLSETDGRLDNIVYEDGHTLDVDAVLIGIGIRPNIELLIDTPVDLGTTGAVATDEYGETNVENVYAAGDVAELEHMVTGETTWSPLGLPANRAGRAIGATVGGSPTEVGHVAETAMLKAFELGCGRAGIVNPDRAEAAGFDPVTKTITAGSRSGYYPGAKETTVTLTADRKSGQLLGGSLVGADRAAVRINTIATALGGEMSVQELEQQDLGYAPPFSPVWDPILVAAKVLSGELE